MSLYKKYKKYMLSPSMMFGADTSSFMGVYFNNQLKILISKYNQYCPVVSGLNAGRCSSSETFFRIKKNNK